MQITLKMLKEKGARYWQDGGDKEMAARIESHLPASLHGIMTCDWLPVGNREWVFEEFAEAAHWQAYEDAEAAHWQAYEDSIAAALIEITKGDELCK